HIVLKAYCFEITFFGNHIVLESPMSTVDTTHTGNAYTPTPSETNPDNNKKTQLEPKPNDSDTVPVEFHINPQHKKLLNRLFLYLSNDGNCCNQPPADNTPAQSKAYTSQENEPKQTSHALRKLLENKNAFAQLDSAQSPDKTHDGMISWEDIHYVLDHPDKYSLQKRTQHQRVRWKF
ncbi:MAG: hypothetical protein P8176_09065, partial [Gammaproteobacteria bacterium]